MALSPLIPEALLHDPPRLLAEWIVPQLARALQEQRSLHDIDADVEVELANVGTWWLAVRKGSLALNTGRAKKPSIIVELDGSDLSELVLGALRPSAALVDGRLELAGDVGLAMRLAPLLAAAVIAP